MVVVVVVVALVEGAAPEVPPVELLLLVEPGPPIELVLLPDVSLLLLVEPGVVLPPEALVLPGVELLPGVVVLLLPVLVPPIALVLPVPLLPGVPLVLLEVEVSRLGAGVVVVVDELDDVVGVPSLLVQAPSDTAAISASAAHEVRDAFIRKLLGGLFAKEGQP